VKPVVGSAAVALEAWLKASGITSGPLFRRILKNGKLGTDGLSGTAVRDIVKARWRWPAWGMISRRIRCDRDSLPKPAGRTCPCKKRWP